MGKRELLLIVCFVIVGAVVYQATAPPPDPNHRGFSFSRLLESVRREIGGNRASTQIATTATQAVDAEITELRIIGFVSEVDITGEVRDDVASTLRVHSAAYTDEEAKKYGQATHLTVDRAAASLNYAVKYPQGRETGRQRATLVLKVPARMRVRVESRPGKLSINNVAAVEATNLGGEATIRGIAGRAAVTHRGGRITIEDVDTLKFTGRGMECEISGVRGDASITVEGGECTTARVGGALELESRNAETTMQGLDTTRGPIRVNAMGGALRMRGVKSDTRVDARNVELDIAMSAPAPVALYTDGGDVELTPPPGGFKLDAVIVDGRIEPEVTVKELGLIVEEPSGESRELRASGTIKGGGPTITIRTTRGGLTLGAHEPLEKPAGRKDSPKK